MQIAQAKVQIFLPCTFQISTALITLLCFINQLLDVVALLVCLEEMSPSEEVLLGPDTRRTWCDKVLSIRQAVEDMMRKELFQAVSEKTSNYGDKAKALIGRCR